MKCLNCGTVFDGGNICPSCGIDAYLMRKAKNASVRLYNKAVSQISERDLTGAENSLKASVAFDKYNYTARNLLGLVFYEKGEIADALKHWIISASHTKNENLATQYIDILQNNARKMDLLNDAVSLYNQALLYLRQNDIDMAIIQLKKAIDINEGLLEARNMLALCYIYSKKYDLAKEHIERVFEKDAFNPTALGYMSVIKNLGNKNGKRKILKKKEAKFFYKDYNDGNAPIIGVRELISFIVGLAVTAGIIVFLVLPMILESKNNEIDGLVAQLYEANGQKTIASADNSSQIAKLIEENEKLKKEVENYKNNASLQERLITLQEAMTLAANGDLENAALAVNGLNTEGFGNEDLAKLNTVKENSFAGGAKSLFEKGKNEFLNGNYAQGKQYLENCIKLVSTGEFVDDAIYYLGKIAESEGKTAEAKAYYRRVIDEFPNSNQMKNARNSIDGLR